MDFLDAIIPASQLMTTPVTADAIRHLAGDAISQARAPSIEFALALGGVMGLLDGALKRRYAFFKRLAVIGTLMLALSVIVMPIQAGWFIDLGIALVAFAIGSSVGSMAMALIVALHERHTVMKAVTVVKYQQKSGFTRGKNRYVSLMIRQLWGDLARNNPRKRFDGKVAALLAEAVSKARSISSGPQLLILVIGLLGLFWPLTTAAAAVAIFSMPLAKHATAYWRWSVRRWGREVLRRHSAGGATC